MSATPAARGNGALDPYLSLRDRLMAGEVEFVDSWLALSDAMDTAVEQLTVESGVAVVALGSYGRRQLCIHSDIDLMIVVPTDVQNAPGVFRALWDAGLSVGHAVRTPAQARAAAAERIDTLCSLLDARLVCGDEELFDELQRQIDAAISPESDRAAIIAEEIDRRASEPHHLQALDLKAGRGTLRALHGLRWARTIGSGLGATDATDLDALVECERTLLTARQAVHSAAGRAHDVLDFSLRRPAAASLDKEPKIFLGEVYAAARSIDSALSSEFELSAGSSTPQRRRLPFRRRARHETADDTVEPGTNPWTLAAGAVQRGGLSPELTPAEVAAAERFDGEIWTEEARAAFVRLACAGPGARRVTDQLEQAGFLDVALPEWSHVVSQAQLDPFHVHPVDDHLWRTAAHVVALARGDTEEPWADEIAEEIASIDEVILGALFHDIGKGTGRDHSVAGEEIWRSFAGRAGFDQVTTDVVSLLVREHLLLPEVATRHDLDDPAVIADVATRVGDPDVLRMLYLVTIADALSTGPDVWGSWRSSLIRTLFVRTIEALATDGVRETPMRTARIAEVSALWSGELPADTIERHLQDMPEAYALRTPATEVRRHLVLLDPPPGPDDARIDVIDGDEWSDLALVASDRTGLLALVSGVLALSNISIVEARLATRADGIVVDRLQVVDSLREGPVDQDRWPRVMTDLRAALSGAMPLDEHLESKHHHYRSRVDTTIAPRARIIHGADHGTHRIELRGADRVGLLHDVSRVLQDADVDVHFAKIDTQGGRVVDTFHVHLHDDIDQQVLTARLVAAAEVPTSDDSSGTAGARRQSL